MSVNLSTTSRLTCLEHLHEAALLQALSDRFALNEIYSFIGDILVALNPLKPLPTLYAATQLDAYKRTMRPSASALSLRGNAADKKGQLPPHVFAIGGKAFGGLWNATGRTNQSILVSGESGSGKTESTKFLMQFLTSVGRDAATDPVKTSGAVDIGRRILQTNPILESFGNAQTIRNDNSSRFGKFIKIQFSAQHEIVGAQIVSYLLEKVRVLHQNPGERSFHIFYELLEGADAELLRGLGLERGGTYELLHSYGPRFARQRAMTERYAQLFVETVRAFEDTGVEEPERLAIFKILAALLHLGNVNFTVASGQESDATVVTAQSRFHLEKCAELMGVSVDELETLLSSREIKAGAEVMVLKHDPVQAKEICRSLAKAVYGRLFMWLVRRLSDGINYYDSAVSISDESDELATIGILDIFGFESLNSNGFEQLCINYANERLQAQFNEFVFEREQQVYIAEGIDWRNISYPSNAACLALFDDKSNGLFSLLDQECLMPKGSNQALSTKFYRYHGGDGPIETTGLLQPPQLAKSTLPQLMSSFSKYLHRSESQEKAVLLDLKKHTFSASKMERVNHQFVVHHFAGRVCYNVEQFIEKNSDTLPADAGCILSSSRNEVVKAIGAEDDADLPGADNASAGRRRYSMLRAPSVSAQFKNQLDRLLVQIGRTEAHYIRCLKPNELKKPGVFDRVRVVEQMRSVGVLEAVRIARHGYPVRLAHASFIDLFSGFKCFLSERDRSMTSHDLAQALVAVLLAKDFREDTVDCEEKPPGVLTAVTEYGNGRVLDHNECHKDVQVGKTLVFCRSTTYTRFCRYRLELRNHRATVLQKHYRGYRRRKWFQELRAVVVHVQAIVRGFLGRRRVNKLCLLRRANAATRIQACWKRSAAQHKVEEMRKAKRYDAAVRLIQMRVRRFLAQRHFAKALDDKRFLAQRKYGESLNEKREHAAASIIQKYSRRWIDENRCVTMKHQRFRLMVAFNKLRRACLASPATSEVEAEPSPSDDCSMGSFERCQESKSFGDELTRPSLEQEDSSTCDDRMEPLICVSASAYRPSHSRQRSRANSGSHRHCRSSSRDVDRNTLLENEILRLQQMLADHRSGRDGHSRDRWRRSLNNACPRRSVPGDEHSVRAPRPDRRRYSTDGTLSDDEGGEIGDNVSLLPPRRAQSVVPGKQLDHVSLLSRKIEELDEKCKFLEHVVARKNYEEAAHEFFAYSRGSLCGREHFPSADGSLCGDPSVSEAGSDVDSIISSIQNQMDKLRQSIAVKEQVLQTSGKSCTMSFSSSTRPTRSSSAASTTSFPNFLMGEVPRSLSSLPLSESQLSTGGSSHANNRRSGGSSLGFPLTPTSSVASSLYQVPSRSAPAHFGGPGMPRIVKWARSNNCYECEEPFNLFVRRHHCRMCGNSFCHEHSNRRVSVFGIGFDDGPVRVCDKCFTEYYEAPQAPLPPQYPSQYGFASSAMSTSSRYNGL
uniref:Myosin motor domain-containing protein n=1 Tax=Hyaloperonospora arabidopsidis (strain Emoy2) TaxID=559515 RepID=M4BA74_HYAAE